MYITANFVMDTISPKSTLTAIAKERRDIKGSILGEMCLQVYLYFNSFVTKPSEIMRLINTLILVTAFLFISCEKDDKQPLEVDSRLDFVVLKYGDVMPADTLRSISYDGQGRLTQFGYDAYLYNAANKLHRINYIYNTRGPYTPGEIYDHFYEISYDVRGRLKEVSDAKFLNQDGEVIIRPAFQRRSFSLMYEGDSSQPSTQTQDYYSRMFGGESLIGNTLSDFDQTSRFKLENGNVLERITTEKGIKSSKWEPGPGGYIENTSRTTFEYDNKPNAFKQLFGALGIVPEVLMNHLQNERSLLYSKNNVTKIRNGDQQLALTYKYDEKGRIAEVQVGVMTTIQFFYKT